MERLTDPALYSKPGGSPQPPTRRHPVVNSPGLFPPGDQGFFLVFRLIGKCREPDRLGCTQM
jgi:hypothetical protein